MFEYSAGVSRILVSNDCKTAVVCGGEWNDPQVNAVHREMAAHYNRAIVSTDLANYRSMRKSLRFGQKFE